MHYALCECTTVSLVRDFQAQEPYESSGIGTYLAEWAEKKAEELVGEISDAISKVQEVIEKVDSPRVKEVMALLEESRGYVHLCEGLPTDGLSNSSSCLNITEDISELTEIGYDGYELLANMGSEVGYIVEELNDCQSLSIFKQIACYKKAFGNIQEALKEYTVLSSQFLKNATAVFMDIESDVAQCFYFSQSMFSVELQVTLQTCKEQLFL